MMGYYDYGYGMGFFGWIFMALAWIAFIWFIIWLINQLDRNRKSIDRTPQDILKERYARGEITKKEYGEMKKELNE